MGGRPMRTASMGVGAGRGFGLAIIFAIVYSPAALTQDCMTPLASLPLAVDAAGFFDVSASIAGRPLSLTVDTGGSFSMMDAPSANALGLVGTDKNRHGALPGGMRIGDL